MTEEVRIVEVASAPLAAVRASRVAPPQLGQTIMASLDKVYALLRARGVQGLGHNVVLYRVGPPPWDVEIGVQAPEPIAPEGEVIATATPAGRVATVVHWGAYDGLPKAHQAIHTWCQANGFRLGAYNWELYGDWSDDPAKLRTDVFYLVEDLSSEAPAFAKASAGRPAGA
jgi:effector-binding domain-containing protein